MTAPDAETWQLTMRSEMDYIREHDKRELIELRTKRKLLP